MKKAVRFIAAADDGLIHVLALAAGHTNYKPIVLIAATVRCRSQVDDAIEVQEPVTCLSCLVSAP